MNMNKLILFFYFFIFSLFSFGQGIEFTDLSWEEVLVKAKKENRVIFLDTYTDWCMPCKRLEKEVFPQKRLGDYFNKNFINVRLNMETPLGEKLKEDYLVFVFPTMLLINPDETLLNRTTGFKTVNNLIKFGKSAFGSRNTESYLLRQYANGVRKPELLQKLVELKYKLEDGSHEQYADEYMNTQDDWATEENFIFIFKYLSSVDSKIFDYFADNSNAFRNTFGADIVDKKIEVLLKKKIYDSEKEPTLAEIQSLFLHLYPSKGQRLASHYRLKYYREHGDRPNFAVAVLDHYKKFPSNDPSELSEISYTFSKISDDKSQLKQALKLAKKAKKLEKSYSSYEAMAHLYYKLNKKKCAKRYAVKGLKIAHKMHENPSSCEDLLDLINNPLNN